MIRSFGSTWPPWVFQGDVLRAVAVPVATGSPSRSERPDALSSIFKFVWVFFYFPYGGARFLRRKPGPFFRRSRSSCWWFFPPAVGALFFVAFFGRRVGTSLPWQGGVDRGRICKKTSALGAGLRTARGSRFCFLPYIEFCDFCDCDCARPLRRRVGALAGVVFLQRLLGLARLC